MGAGERLRLKEAAGARERTPAAGLTAGRRAEETGPFVAESLAGRCKFPEVRRGPEVAVMTLTAGQTVEVVEAWTSMRQCFRFWAVAARAVCAHPA